MVVESLGRTRCGEFVQQWTHGNGGSPRKYLGPTKRTTVQSEQTVEYYEGHSGEPWKYKYVNTNTIYKNALEKI